MDAESSQGRASLSRRQFADAGLLAIRARRGLRPQDAGRAWTSSERSLCLG